MPNNYLLKKHAANTDMSKIQLPHFNYWQNVLVCLFALYCVFNYSTYFSKLPCRRVIVHSFVSFNVSEITLEKKLNFFISLFPTLYYLANRDSVLKWKTIIRAWVKNHTLRWWSSELVHLSVLNGCRESHSLIQAWAMPPQFFIWEVNFDLVKEV